MRAIRTIVPITLLAALPAQGLGALLTQSPGLVVGTNYRLPMSMVNNDVGAVYDSATLQGLFGPLAVQVYDFGVSVANGVDAFASAQELLDSWSGGLTASGAINVPGGWNISGKDPMEFTHSEGIPNFDYVEWSTGVNAFYILDIPLSLLTASGNAADWGDPSKGPYATITLSETVVEDAFVAITGGATSPIYFADGFAYQLVIIPAPGTAALLGLAALTATRRRR